MIRHYLKIAFRNMQKQKMYAAININGFAIGEKNEILNIIIKLKIFSPSRGFRRDLYV